MSFYSCLFQSGTHTRGCPGKFVIKSIETIVQVNILNHRRCERKINKTAEIVSHTIIRFYWNFDVAITPLKCRNNFSHNDRQRAMKFYWQTTKSAIAKIKISVSRAFCTRSHITNQSRPRYVTYLRRSTETTKRRKKKNPAKEEEHPENKHFRGTW